jgi:hypothetical protein
MNELWITSVVFAVTMTALAGSVGFNRPSWSRTYTTAARYRFAMAAHIAVYLAVLLVAYAVLRRVAAAYGAIDPGVSSALMWLALVVTLCMRGVSRLSRSLRARLHHMSGIPNHASRFAKFLAETELEPSAKIKAQAESMLLSRGIDAEHDWLPLAQPMHRNLRKATQLFIQLREWENDARFSRFANEAKNELDQLRQRFDRMSFRTSRTLQSIERLGELRQLFSERRAPPAEHDEDGTHPLDGDFDDHLRHLASDLIADACEDVSLFYREACTLVARGVLATEGMRGGRDRAISTLGFKPKQREMASPFGVLANAAVLVYVGLWIFFLILPTDTQPPAVPEGTSGPGLSLGQRIAIITVNVIGAFAIAIVPKRHWGFANAGLRPRTPVGFVVAAGVAAALFAVGVNLVAGALLYGGWDGALRRLAEGSTYLHSAFMTAAAVAWLVQDHRWRDTVSVRDRHWRDAATLGAVWLVSSLVAQLFRSGADMDDLMRWPTLAIAIGGGVFGAVLGYFVPGAVRDEQLRRPSPAFALTASDFHAGPVSDDGRWPSAMPAPTRTDTASRGLAA